MTLLRLCKRLYALAYWQWLRYQPWYRVEKNRRGNYAEKIARVYLNCRSLATIDYNYRCRWGEIDIIMKDKNTWVFVEVRARQSQNFGGAAQSVTADKQHKIQRSARHFMMNHIALSPDANCRFDIVAIENNDITWLQNVF